MGNFSHDDFYFGIGFSYGSEGFKTNFNVFVDKDFGNDFTGSYGFGITYHDNFYTTGKSGYEFRNSFMVNHSDGSSDISIGTNLWDGLGEMEEFEQRTGMLKIRRDDFSFSYENDGGAPFNKTGLGDGRDSYRTAAANLTYKETSLNLNLFTGLRDHDSFKIEKNSTGGTKGISEGIGQFGEYYKHGFVFEKGPKYRYGGLTLNQNGLSKGTNSEWIRHTFQNELVHGWLNPQRQFPMLSDDWKPVEQPFKASKFTIWGE